MRARIVQQPGGGWHVESRKWWMFPKKIGRFRPYALRPTPLGDNLPPEGIRGPLRTTVFWSRGERYVALSEDTWFCDVHDFSTGSHRHFEPEIDAIASLNPPDALSELESASTFQPRRSA